MNSLLVKKASRFIAWTMTIATSVWLAAPAQVASAATYRYSWVSQTPAQVTADGVAHYVSANQGDSVNLSVTLINKSSITIKGKSTLGATPAGYQVPIGSWAIGVRNDEVKPWIDTTSWLNGNRMAYYDGPDVAPGAQFTVSFTVKIADSAANGAYDLYYRPVSEYMAWTNQVAWNGTVLGFNNSDIFTRFFVGTTPTVSGNLNVSIASSTPAASNIAKGAADVHMANFTFAAGASDNAMVKSIAITRTGFSVDADVTGIKLFDGMTQLGSEQSFNTTTHKATFTGLSWLIPAGTSKTLTVKASVATTNVGAVIQLAISSAADITLNGTGTIGGTFPAVSNGFTIANVSVGTFTADVQAAPATGNVLSGSTDQSIASFKFVAATEGFNVNSLTFTEVGTSVDSDVSNFRLKINGVQIGSTMPTLVNGKVTFTGSPLFVVPVGQNRTVYISADIASGITSQRTVIFQLYQAADIVAVGQNSGGQVVTQKAGPAAYTSQTGNTQTIIQGTLGVTRAATNLSAQSYVVGTEQAEVAKWKFSASATEGIKVTKLTFTNGGTTPTAADIQNARLYINGSAVATDDSGTITATTIAFSNGNGLFTVPVSGNTEVTLKVDISSSATTSHTLQYYLSAVTDLEIYGVSSNAKIDSTASNITPITDVNEANASDHTLAAAGTLIVAIGPSTPPAGNFSLGTSNFEFAQFTMQAISEAAQVTALTVRFFDDTAIAGDDSGNGATTGDVTNAKLYRWDGASWVQLGSTIITPTTGVATFSFSHIIPANTTETFKIVADIPTGASLTNLFIGIDGTGDGFQVYDDVTASGVSSGVSYNSGTYMTGSVDSSLFTKVTPTITATMSTVPVARSVVINTSNAVLGRLLLTASAGEDINISTLRIAVDDTAISGNGGPSAATTNFSNIRLGVDTDNNGTYDLTTIAKPFTDGGAGHDYVAYSGSDFNNPTSWKIPSAGTLVVDILGNAVGSSGDWSFGMVDDDPVTSIVGAGANSGTTATISGLTSAITSAVLTLTTGGSLAITLDTQSPQVQQVTASFSSNVAATVSRFKFAATNEDIRLEMIRVTSAADGNDLDFKSMGIHLYEGGTVVNNMLTGGTLVGSGTLTGTGAESVDITLSPQVIVPVSGTKYITIVADMNTIAGGAASGDVPKLGIDQDIATGNWTGTDPDFSGNLLNVKARGVSSGTGIGTAAAGSVDLLGNALYVVKTKLGLAVNSASPSGTATEQANHTIFKLSATNSSTDTDARIRAAQSYDTADATGWSAIGGTTVAADAAAYITTGAVKFSEAELDADDGVGYDSGNTTTLDDYTRVNFWVRVSATGVAAGDLVFNTSTAANLETSAAVGSVEIPALAAATWYNVDSAITNTGARYFGVILEVDTLTVESVTIDRVMFYNDKIGMSLSSNGGLFNTASTPITTPVAYLKDGATTVATGYYSGTGTSGLSTSVGRIIFIPTTEIAIPVSGKVFDVVTDSSALMIVDSKNLTMSIDLGSATAAGVITAGDVMWDDNGGIAVATRGTIGWVESTTNPLARSLSF